MYTAVYFDNGKIVEEKFITIEEARARCVKASMDNINVKPINPVYIEPITSRTRDKELQKLIYSTEEKLKNLPDDIKLAVNDLIRYKIEMEHLKMTCR